MFYDNDGWIRIIGVCLLVFFVGLVFNVFFSKEWDILEVVVNILIVFKLFIFIIVVFRFVVCCIFFIIFWGFFGFKIINWL